MRILNIHDLGQDGENTCYNELLKYWSKKQIISDTYDLAEEDPAAILLDSMASGPYDLIVGTGFGGVLALLAGRATGARTVLVNPMYPIQQYLPTELPDYDYGVTLVKYEHNSICWDTKHESLKNVFLILGRDDDIVDTARMPYYFYEGNARFVDGGHFPDGEDFAQAFGELTGGIAATRRLAGKESQALSYLKEYFEGQGSRMFYVYGPERRQMTGDAKRLVQWAHDNCPSQRCLYLSADELPECQKGLRDSYQDVGFLAIDNIRKELITDSSKRSLWVVCDEVIGHGGKVLIISDETAIDVFGDDKDIMEVIWTGRVKECWGRIHCEEENNLFIDDDSYCSRDLAPYLEYARHMKIDDVDTSDGHIVVYWSCPGETAKEHALYLYYADGKWHRDEEDGANSSEERAALILSKASELIIAQTDCVKHDAQNFWGWGW